ncbi:MAG: hypothetical protein A2711_16760 [Burkholderiales bacterium RIFCSPHIGHO2_01_FULL_63_240]|jgi:hypothetical protein|nr:MAG: hypothetical protein A2711_16760 [Burkholderiales bacterium RIFCSPHIGHO2_01_FULL_63_240]
MQFSFSSLRTIALAAAVGAVSFSAQADLTIPLNATVSDSVQAFPEPVMRAFKAVDILVEGKGTTSALDAPGIGGNSSTFNFPITRIVIGPWLSIKSGSAVGSALVFTRVAYDEITDEESTKQLTLANFTIDYVGHRVLADTTHSGKTIRQMPVYNFNTATPLGLRYKFPLAISGYEQLDQLYLTPEAKAAYTDGLALPIFALPSLKNDFGTLTQTVTLKLRSRPISTRPYVAQ